MLHEQSQLNKTSGESVQLGKTFVFNLKLSVPPSSRDRVKCDIGVGEDGGLIPYPQRILHIKS